MREERERERETCISYGCLVQSRRAGAAGGPLELIWHHHGDSSCRCGRVLACWMRREGAGGQGEESSEGRDCLLEGEKEKENGGEKRTHRRGEQRDWLWRQTLGGAE